MAITFGKTYAGGTLWNFKIDESDSIRIALKCKSGGAGSLASISAYFNRLVGGTYAKCAIYDSDYNLLTNGETEKKEIPTGLQWHTFNFPIPPEVSESTTYFLVLWVSGHFYLTYDSSIEACSREVLSGQVVNSFPVTWNPPNKDVAHDISIYATYKTGGELHISTLDELQAMKDNLQGHFFLDNDIDAAATSGWNGGAGFEPIGIPAGWGKEFQGAFNGQNHRIKNLYINRPTATRVGLFGQASIYYIKNVGIVDCDITGAWDTGALGGYVLGGDITKCYSTGKVKGGSNSYYAGLIGEYYGSGTMSQCYSTVDVSAPSGAHIGGLVGRNGSTVINCYAQGAVTAGGTIGGLVGSLVGTIENCYSVGKVSSEGTYVHGLVGMKEASGQINSCFYDTETSGQEDGYGIGKTTEQMHTKSTFTDAGWDFDTIWYIIDGESYPWLQWQPVTPVAAFSAQPLKGKYPLTVNFTDASTNTPTSWLWNFGDGHTSTEQNPIHQYTSEGSFTVSLTATNSAGSDTETKTNYISAVARSTYARTQGRARRPDIVRSLAAVRVLPVARDPEIRRQL